MAATDGAQDADERRATTTARERLRLLRARARAAVDARPVWQLVAIHVGGVFAMTLAAASRLGTPASAATLAFAGIALVPARGLRKRGQVGSERSAVAIGVAAIAGLGITAVVVTAATSLDLAFAFAGFVLVYFAAGQAVFLWRAAGGAPHRATRVLGVAVGGALAGLAAVTATSRPWGLVGIVAGIAFVPVGVALLTQDTEGHDWRLNPALPWVGSTLLASGMAIASLAGASRSTTVLGALLLFGLVAAIASNTTLDITLLVLAGALVWALLPTNATDRSAVVPERGDRVLISLGDSYASGEGATRFYEGTNVRGVNECRRSPDAHPVALAPDGGATVFLACSGAVGHDVVGAPRGFDDRQAAEDPAGYARSWGSQVDAARAIVAAHDLEPVAILLSIGGNDAGFARIGVTCGLPGDCSHLGATWLDELAHVDAVLHRTYGGVAALAAELGDVPVVVVPYPVPIDEVGCDGSLLSRDEHQFLAGYTRQLNRVVRRNAEAWGFEVATDVSRVLADRRLRICDGPARSLGINAIAANPVSGTFVQQISPLTWFRNSFHPNARGHEAVASAIAPTLAAAIARPRAAPVDPPPSGTVTTVASLDTLLREGFEHCGLPERRPPTCRSSVDEWTVAQIARTLRLATVPTLLIAAGAWVLSISALDRRRDLRQRARD